MENLIMVKGNFVNINSAQQSHISSEDYLKAEIFHPNLMDLAQQSHLRNEYPSKSISNRSINAYQVKFHFILCESNHFHFEVIPEMFQPQAVVHSHRSIGTRVLYILCLQSQKKKHQNIGNSDICKHYCRVCNTRHRKQRRRLREWEHPNYSERESSVTRGVEEAGPLAHPASPRLKR